MKSQYLINRQVTVQAHHDLLQWCLHHKLDTDLTKKFVDSQCKKLLRHNFRRIPYQISYLVFHANAVDNNYKPHWLAEFYRMIHEREKECVFLFHCYEDFISCSRMFDGRGLEIYPVTPKYMYCPKYRAYGYVAIFKRV